MSHRMKKVGFYGGTFDPIHHGHLHIALEAYEKCDLDEILFCPAAVSPFKQDKMAGAKGKDRLAMIQLAIEDIEGFSLSDVEIQREGPSYTIDTIKELKQLRPHDQFFLILADDQLEGFSLWKESELLQTLAPLKIGSRLFRTFEEVAALRESLSKKDCFFGPLLEISSTMVRERLKKGLYCKHLIPPKVVDYIHSHGLYLTD